VIPQRQRAHGKAGGKAGRRRGQPRRAELNARHEDECAGEERLYGRDKPRHDKSRRRCYLPSMLLIETEREDDGRWLAEVPALPGVLSYGASDTEARSRATALALRVIAERVENGEALPGELSGMFQLA
jgi:predicted RNase H-like HicB family nuclease